MPIFLFEHPETKEIIEIFLSIHDKKEYFENGISFNRIFTVPNAAVDTKIDPMNAADFSRKSMNKSGTIGSLQDQSKELSIKRKEKLGYDPIKQKYLEDWSKKRKGKIPPPSMTQD